MNKTKTIICMTCIRLEFQPRIFFTDRALSSAIWVAMITLLLRGKARVSSSVNLVTMIMDKKKSSKCQKPLVEHIDSIYSRFSPDRHISLRLPILSKYQNIKLTPLRSRSRID